MTLFTPARATAIRKVSSLVLWPFAPLVLPDLEDLRDWRCWPGPPDLMGQARRLQGADEIPTDIDLPPAQPEACRTRVEVMVPVPVLAPRRHLQRSQPPDILAGVPLLGVTEMGETVHQTLHVQGIDQTNGTHPEEAPPSERNAAAQREHQHGHFNGRPEPVTAEVQIGAPFLYICRG